MSARRSPKKNALTRTADTKSNPELDWTDHADDLTFNELERLSVEFIDLTRADVQHSLLNPTPVGLVRLSRMIQLLALRAATAQGDANWRRLRDYLQAVADLSDSAYGAMKSGALGARNPLTSTPLPCPLYKTAYMERALVAAIAELRARDVIETLDRMVLPALRGGPTKPTLSGVGVDVFVRPDEFAQWSVSAGVTVAGEFEKLFQMQPSAPGEPPRVADWIKEVRARADEIARTDKAAGRKVSKTRIANKLAENGVLGARRKVLEAGTIERQALRDWKPPD